MFDLILRLAQWWLGGAKYDFSRFCNRSAWDLDIEPVLRSFDFDLSACQTPRDVVELFRGRYFWKPDPFFQSFDIVQPPLRLMLKGGDDCDGMAMLHAQAIELALAKAGWETYIVSYFAKPFWNSHHFALARDPRGRFWAIQPQPTRKQHAKDPNLNIVFGSYDSPAQAAEAIVAMYKSKIRTFDVRDSHYRPVAAPGP